MKDRDVLTNEHHHSVSGNMLYLNHWFTAESARNVVTGLDSDRASYNRLLGYPDLIINYTEFAKLGSINAVDDESLEVKFSAFCAYIDSVDYIVSKAQKIAVVLNANAEGLPIEAVRLAGKIARHYSTCSVYYVSGASPVPITFDYFNKWKGDTTNLKLITQNTFEGDRYSSGYMDFKQHLSTDKQKKFHFFMGAPRMHRYMLLALLEERGVLDQGILSYGWWKGESEVSHADVLRQLNMVVDDSYRDAFKDCIKVVTKHLPNIPQRQNPYLGGWSNMENPSRFARTMQYRDHEIYNSSWFHVTTETSNITSTQLEKGWQYPSNNPLFITEKTYRPLVTGQVGITVGQQGILTELTSLGYKPFNQCDRGNMTNNPTDEIYDDQERLIAQADSIARMCSWSDQLWRHKATEYQARDMMHNKNKKRYAPTTYLLHDTI
tara:strand:+ start:7323 stop:8630 length:1308 start_codon:yes stop_codon:yes gene_type:complete